MYDNAGSPSEVSRCLSFQVESRQLQVQVGLGVGCGPPTCPKHAESNCCWNWSFRIATNVNSQAKPSAVFFQFTVIAFQESSVYIKAMRKTLVFVCKTKLGSRLT